MDDELEDEIMYQTLISHFRLLSRFLTVSLNNTALAYIVRYLRFYLFKPEAIAIAFVVAAAVFFFNSAELWYKNVISRLIPTTRLKYYRTEPYSKFMKSSEKLTWQVKQGQAGIYAIQGRRPRMEDRYSVLDDASSGIALYGIFDGHGGESAAEFVEKSLFKTLLKRLQEAKSTLLASAPECDPVPHQPKESSDDAESQETSCPQPPRPQQQSTVNSLTTIFSKLLTEEILAVDKKLLVLAKKANDFAGTTALVALVHDNQLIVANVGDSRGVICDSKGNAIPLSFDHKPHQIKEQKRIKEAGGFITFNGVWRVAGILATSRALGDYPLKDRNLIIAEPDILTFDLRDLKPQFMILASDGLWDEFSNEEAVSYILEHLDEPLHGADSIAKQSYWNGSADNISVIVVDFRNHSSVKEPTAKTEE